MYIYIYIYINLVSEIAVFYAEFKSVEILFSQINMKIEKNGIFPFVLLVMKVFDYNFIRMNFFLYLFQQI
jgi:hypothetical protein